jgi:tetratricopeptide (TPR) repeat protein
VGVLLFHLVTGSYPVLGRTLGEIREAHASRRRRSLGDVKGDVPAGFVKLVERALELDPDRRYESAEAMEAALNSVEPRGLPSRPPETVHDIQGMFRSRTLQLSVLTLLVAAGVTAAVAMRPDPTPLTERDVVMVADFDNTTGDSVFDVMLREALSVRLAQSSFLNTVPDTRIRETLHLMERPDDTRITHAIARDICQRLGTKAVLGGSIAPLGSHYVLTVTATNCRTGELLVREQREAPSKERVLTTLSDAASSLQNKLGESLASVQTFTPPDEWRTSSLDALRAFTEGRQLHGRGRSGQAIPHLIRALEIDPQLLGAHRELGAAYYYVGEFRRGREQLAKAYALRDRGTESQRQFITASYYRHGIGNREKAREASEFWRRNFPDNGTAAMFCALENSDVGRFEEGVALLYESNRLGVPVGHNLGANLANLLRGLHRYNEAKGIVARAAESGFDTALMHSTLYTVAFIEGDARAMQREVEWFKGKDTEHLIIANQAATAAFGGQIGESRRLQQQAIELALRADRDEVAAEYRSAQALVEAMIGNDREVLEERLRFHVTSGNGPLALAFAGRGRAARQFTDQSRKEWPEHTLLNAVSLPTAMAALEIRNGDAAKAIGLLEAARAFEPVATSLRAAYTRGLAYLKLGAGIEAAKEFQKVLDHRGVLPLSVLYPLSQLGLARAQVLAGDHAAAVKAYKDFFTTWKHADLDIPVFVQAWQEYARISP